MRSALTCSWLALLAAACTSSHDVPAPVGLDIPLTGSDPTASAKCKQEMETTQDGLPTDFECAGLFTDVPNRTLFPDARPYTPAKILWSDGASKLRWVRLPAGTTIDSSNQAEWKF